MMTGTHGHEFFSKLTPMVLIKIHYVLFNKMQFCMFLRKPHGVHQLFTSVDKCRGS